MVLSQSAMDSTRMTSPQWYPHRKRSLVLGRAWDSVPLTIKSNREVICWWKKSSPSSHLLCSGISCNIVVRQRIDLIKSAQTAGNGWKPPCLMTVYSHIEIKLYQIISKVLQINSFLTKFNNYGYHTVLCRLACVSLSGAGSVIGYASHCTMQMYAGRIFKQYDKTVLLIS